MQEYRSDSETDYPDAQAGVPSTMKIKGQDYTPITLRSSDIIGQGASPYGLNRAHRRRALKAEKQRAKKP